MYNSLKNSQNYYQNFGKNLSKKIFWAQNFQTIVSCPTMIKMTKKIENFSKKIFGRNRFRMVQNVFQDKNIDFENFSPLKIFFLGHSRFFKKWEL